GQRAPDRLLHLGRLRRHRVAQTAQMAAQTIDLIEQAQDQRHRLVIDGEIAPDLKDQLDPRDIDLAKHPALLVPLGQDPAILDPAGELAAIEAAAADQELVNRDHAAPMPRRGSTGCLAAQSSRNAASSASPLAPTTTFKVTI